MRVSGNWIVAITTAVLSIAPRASGAAPEPVPRQQDALVRFLAEAPAAYGALEAAASRWEVRYTATFIYYSGDGTGSPTRELKNSVRTLLDDRHGGMRSETNVIADSKQPTSRSSKLVNARNPQYTFEVQSEGDQPFYISSYKEAQKGRDEAKLWVEQMEGYGGLSAEDFDGSSLLRLVQSGEVKVKSFATVDVDGKTCVRFETERVFTSVPNPKPLPGWVVVDPNFHWAVRSYEQQFVTGGKRRVSVEYSSQVADHAFPARIVRNDFNGKGQLWNRVIMEFESPQPSKAAASDFTLGAFGLEPPRSVQASGAGRIRALVALNVVVLGAAGIWLAFLYRKRRQKRVSI